MSLEVYFRAAPWALPVLAVGAVVLLALCRPLARRLGWAWWEVLGLGLPVLGFLAVTTTPSDAGRPMGADRQVSLDADLVAAGDLVRLHLEPVLNVWLAVPMALAAAYVAVRHRRWWPVVLVVALPPLAEGVQWAFPPLGRAAFLLADVVANEQGVVGGLLLGAAVGALLHRRPLAARRGMA